MMTTILATVQSAPPAAWGHPGGGWWFPFGLIFWIGITALVVRLVTRVNRPRQQPAAFRGARDILAERFARGEIDSDEYEERLSHL